jgi:predicted aspartyl protease
MLQIFAYSLEIRALVDTGFDGDVSVPAAMLGSVLTDDRPADGVERWTLADGSLLAAPVYRATATLQGIGSIGVAVSVLGDEPLIGRGVLDHFLVTFDHGRRIILEP